MISYTWNHSFIWYHIWYHGFLGDFTVPRNPERMKSYIWNSNMISYTPMKSYMISWFRPWYHYYDFNIWNHIKHMISWPLWYHYFYEIIIWYHWCYEIIYEIMIWYFGYTLLYRWTCKTSRRLTCTGGRYGHGASWFVGWWRRWWPRSAGSSRWRRSWLRRCRSSSWGRTGPVGSLPEGASRSRRHVRSWYNGSNSGPAGSTGGVCRRHVGSSRHRG